MMFWSRSRRPVSGYQYTAGEAHALRVEQLQKSIIPAVQRVFAEHERLRSALLCIGQYWDDEAHDAVHNMVVFSELDEPDFDHSRLEWDEPEEFDGAAPPDPNVPNTLLPDTFGRRPTVPFSATDLGDWDDNGSAIPLWAAFAPENGDQEFIRFQEVYAPAVLIRRDGTYEFCDMQRPWLDGIQPAWRAR